MKKSSYIIIPASMFVFILLSAFKGGSDIFSGFQILKQPIADPTIIGRSARFGLFTGAGFTAKEYKSFGEFQQKQSLAINGNLLTAKIKGKILGAIGFSVQDTQTVSLTGGIKILMIEDLEMLAFNKGDRIVVGAILVDSITVFSRKELSAGFGFEVKKALKNNANADTSKVKVGLSATRNVTRLAFGTDLIIAVKVLEFSSKKEKTYSVPIQGAKGGPVAGYTISFKAMKTQTGTPEIDDHPAEHRACVNVWFSTNQVFENDGSGRYNKERAEIYCPRVSEIASDGTQPDATYIPDDEFSWRETPFVLSFPRKNYKEIVWLQAQLANIRITYGRKPQGGLYYNVDNAVGSIKIIEQVWRVKEVGL